MSINVDSAVDLLTQCLAEAQAVQVTQPAKSDGKRVTTSLVRAINRSRLRALDIQ